MDQLGVIEHNHRRAAVRTATKRNWTPRLRTASRRPEPTARLHRTVETEVRKQQLSEWLLLLWQTSNGSVAVPACWLHQARRQEKSIVRDRDRLAETENEIEKLIVATDPEPLARLLPETPTAAERRRVKEAYRFSAEYQLADFLFQQMAAPRAPVTTRRLAAQWDILANRVVPEYRPRTHAGAGKDAIKMGLRRWRRKWGAWYGVMPSREAMDRGTFSAKARGGGELVDHTTGSALVV